MLTGNEQMDQQNYLMWQRNLGVATGSGSGGAEQANVPEPAALFMAALSLLACAALRPRNIRAS
jgi:hypothetical protein